MFLVFEKTFFDDRATVHVVSRGGRRFSCYSAPKTTYSEQRLTLHVDDDRTQTLNPRQCDTFFKFTI